MSEHKTDAKWVRPGVPARVIPMASADRLVNRRLRSRDDLLTAAPAWMREAAELQAVVGAALTVFLPRWQRARRSPR